MRQKEEKNNMSIALFINTIYPAINRYTVVVVSSSKLPVQSSGRGNGAVAVRQRTWGEGAGGA